MALKCYFHPRLDAIYECTLCNKPICGDCMRFDDEDRVVCPACTLEKAMEIADDDQRQHFEDIQRRAEIEEKATRGKPAFVNGWLLVALILLIGLHVFLRSYVDRAGQPARFDVQLFAKVGDPAPEMTYLAAKIFAFAADHDGRVPEKLGQLFPDYIEAQPVILGSDEAYNFTPVQGEERFVLSLPKADRFGYRRLYATGDGVLRVE